MFIGGNLANLRVLHGYSRKQLSERLHITEQAVWQYEHNYTSPKMQVINELKRIFDVKSKYFLSDDVLKRKGQPGNINPINIAYRSKIVHVISKTQTEAKHVEYLDAFVKDITAPIQYPSFKIKKLKNDVIDYVNTTEDERNLQIEKIAQLARERLNFREATNEDLCFLIEKSGVFVFEKAIGEDIDAYGLWTQQETPYIILGNMKRSAVRRNFDLAHELGHLLLHYHLEFTSLDRKEHKSIENEANTFAGAFLLPQDEFIKDMEAISHKTNPDAYLDLKEKWSTSLQVLGYRAANLGLINKKDHRNFYASLHRKGYLKREPLDETLPIQKPMKVKSIIDLIVKRGLIDLRQLIEEDWKVDLNFYHHMTGIDSKFFSSYLNQHQDFELKQIADFQ